MSGDFNWWLVLVGVIVGGALTWLVLADSQRRERDIGDDELSAEAGWIARTLHDPFLDADQAERVLRAHRRYLRFPPPDTLVDPETLREAGAAPAVPARPAHARPADAGLSTTAEPVTPASLDDAARSTANEADRPA